LGARERTSPLTDPQTLEPEGCLDDLQNPRGS
jgi:hypothetical protein